MMPIASKFLRRCETLAANSVLALGDLEYALPFNLGRQRLERAEK